MNKKDRENVIAIFCSDIHLSLRAPIWRSAESDWLEAQSRPLLEVQELKDKYKCPILCAGDIFDRNKKIADGWDAPAELINYAINYLPEMYAIPGQHDLPNHQYDDIHRSAFQTLVKAKKIIELTPETVEYSNGLKIYGFPPGHKLEGCPKQTNVINIALVHDYVWTGRYHYPNAPKEKKIKCTNMQNGKLYGFDVIVYGDNHQGFSIHVGKTTVFNCGTLMRRKSDEIDYKPQVGLLLETREVVPYYLDISKDKYLDTIDEKTDTELESELDMTSFMEELEKLGETALNFKDAMKQFLHRGKTSDEAKQIILEAMEK